MHYYDCWTDDARLTLETIQAAVEQGAIACNHLGVSELLRTEGRLSGARVADRVTGTSYIIVARQIVNATGPWLDRVRRLDEPAAAPVLRLTKGVHVVVPRERVGNRNAIVLRAPRDGRVMFAIPWEDQTLVGTTDTDYDARPENVAADADDVRYLLEAVNAYFPAAGLGESDVVGAYAGLRPLVAPAEAESPSETSREEEIFESTSGLLSLGGGKLTTYRRVSEKVVDRVVARLRTLDPERRFEECRTGEVPLPGARVEDRDRGGFVGFAKRLRANVPPAVDDGLVRHLLGRYGAAARELVATVLRDPASAGRLIAGLPYRRIEVTRAASAEMAVTLDDVLRRRLPISFRHPDGGAAIASEVGALMRDVLGWNAAETEAAVERYRTGAEEERRRRQQPAAAEVDQATATPKRSASSS
jgi:glycerol-3-phosphate dehydrogenase